MRYDLIVLAKRLPDCHRHYPVVLASALILVVTLVLCLHMHQPRTAHAQQPPWIYGAATARFTVVEFADLECAYCRLYFPTLRAWVNAHPDVNWEWRHLPLAEHEPTATQDAELTECAGEVGGPRLFWSTVDWLYGHPDHRAPRPEGLFNSRVTSAVRACLESNRPQVTIRRQVAEARQEGITATPTLRLTDHHRGQSVVLTGPIPPDILSSAIDALASSSEVLPALNRRRSDLRPP